MEVFSTSYWESCGWRDEVETTGPSHSGGSHQTDKGKVLYIKTYPNPYKTKKSSCTSNIFIMKNIGMQQGFHFVSQILKQCCLNDVLFFIAVGIQQAPAGSKYNCQCVHA